MNEEASAADVRRWARKQGLQVASRGRLSPELREAYERASRRESPQFDKDAHASGGTPARTGKTLSKPAAASSVRTVVAKPRWDWQRYEQH